MFTGLGKEKEMMVGVLTHSSTARACFWMQVQIPSLPQGEVKHQQPCFKNHRGFSMLGCPEASLQKVGLSARHGSARCLQQAPRSSAEGSSPPGRCSFENTSHQPISGSHQVKRNGTYSSEKRFFQFSVPGKGSFY